MTGRIYEIARLRCNLCRKQFKADPPPGVGTEKYDASAAAMVALLKYGSGMPFYRLAALQNGFGDGGSSLNVAQVTTPNPLARQAELVGRLDDIEDKVDDLLLKVSDPV